MKRIQQPSMQEAEQASLNHEILTTWRPGETLGEHMERRGVSRREFNKWCRAAFPTPRKLRTKWLH